ncbi:MAG: DUF1178 family protein [Phyllobacteriaceae bacterium]|nr:DUF1178 family protein [Phyllobacteriaceae bacterium]
MIRFSLQCDNEHGFEAWFASGDAFDTQARRGLVDCLMCGSRNVHKALMTPGIVTARRAAPAQVETTMSLALDPERAEMLEKLRGMARAVRESADYVGKDFAEEARKIHFGEVEARGIYGEASGSEVEALLEDGIAIAPLPMLPDDRN